MAKFSDVNNTMNTPALAWYRILVVMVAAGWVVKASSDATTYNATGNQLSSGGTGAGGLGNAGAWFRAQDPAGRREVVLQNSGANSRVLFSEISKFTGGTPGATRVPTATDQQFVCGGGTDASPTYTAIFPNGTTYRLHCTALSTAIGGVYAVHAFTTSIGSAAQGAGTFLLEPMAPGSYDVADPSPMILFCGTAALTTSTALCWLAYGTGGQVFVTASCNVGIYTGALGTDPIAGSDNNGYPDWYGPFGGTNRIKGVGSLLAAKGPARTYPATANTATDARVYLGAWCYLYPDNTVPSVA